MHLLYVFPEPFPLQRARGVQVAHSVAALARAGVAVVFAYVPAGQGDPFLHYGVIRPNNVQLVPLARGLPWPFDALKVHSNRLFLWRLARWLRAARRTGYAPQFIFARHLKLASGLLRAFPEIPLVYEAHEVFADVAPPNKRERLARIEETVLQRAAVLIAITQGAAEDLKRRYRLERPIHVLHDAVTLPTRVPSKPWHEAGRRIVYAGSFFAWKGAQDIVAAAALLPGCRITLIGGTPEQVEKLKASLPAGGAEVVFTGHIRHEEVMAALGTACIALLPNRREPNSMWSSPLKLFEYMASGCAVVATDLPSVHEVLEADDAVWVSPGDPESLAAGIRALVQDPERARRLGERLHAMAGRYTWDARAARLKEIISGAVNARN